MPKRRQIGFPHWFRHLIISIAILQFAQVRGANSLRSYASGVRYISAEPPCIMTAMKTALICHAVGAEDAEAYGSVPSFVLIVEMYSSIGGLNWSRLAQAVSRHKYPVGTTVTVSRSPWYGIRAGARCRAWGVANKNSPRGL
jgi:hypothetical protein